MEAVTRQTRGFSFVELGIAILILALTIVPILDLLQGGVKGTAQSLYLSRAFQAARSVADSIYSCPWSSLDDATVKTLASKIEVPDGCSRPRVDSIQLITSSLPNGSVLETKVATIRVGWVKTEGKDKTGEVVLTAAVSLAR